MIEGSSSSENKNVELQIQNKVIKSVKGNLFFSKNCV
jgi:hypothetical protein